MGQRKAAKPKPAGAAQPVPVPPLATPHAPLAAAPVQPADATAAGVAEQSMAALRELEQKKKRLGTQLKDVERQIYDLETRYLEGCNPNANALTGYEGLHNSIGSSKPGKSQQPVAHEDRIFSGSSTTTPPTQ